ncbi:MAG: AhpC/TSA family protein [bacterium]|nr:AhpC/TSA family protein [bacterium]
MKYVVTLCIGFLLFSCDSMEETSESGTPSKALEDNFTITGKIENGQNMTFYLEAQSQSGVIEVAKATSDGTGQFEMKGNIPGYGIYSLRMGETKEKVIPMTLVPNDKVHIDASSATFKTPTVSGTDWSELMTEYMKVYGEFDRQNTMLKLNPENLPKEEVNERYQELSAGVDEFIFEQLDNDPSNPFNVVLIPSAIPKQGFNGWPEENLVRLKRVEQSLMDRFPDSKYVENLGYQIYQIEQEFEKHQNYNSGTIPAPDIAMANPEGEIMRLSDLRGQYVLVDFWASWCGPCRRENPNVVRLYNKYKNKGFTIFSVSLDQDPEAWKAAIIKDGLSWPNHVSDLKRWESPVIQQYGFSGIPFTVLLNKEGNFIAVNLRGEALEQKLKELFEK